MQNVLTATNLAMIQKTVGLRNQFSGWQKISNVKMFKNIKLQLLTCITLNTWKFGKRMWTMN